MVVSQPSTVFIVRHGERLDHVSKHWQPDPAHRLWDPPLSSKGHRQAEQTGAHLTELMRAQSLLSDETTVIVYTSPFQRCVDTALGMIKGMTLERRPVLRMDVGLGEWMCERFFDEVCSASRLIARQQETLARRQVLTWASPASTETNSDLLQHVLPPVQIDYGYRSARSDFDFPERYTNMLQRFDETRLDCLTRALQDLPKPCITPSSASAAIVVFVTHAAGVNALLDGFRNQITRPLEASYCSVSCVQWQEGEKNARHPSRWAIQLEVSSHHLNEAGENLDKTAGRDHDNLPPKTTAVFSPAATAHTPSALPV